MLKVYPHAAIHRLGHEIGLTDLSIVINEDRNIVAALRNDADTGAHERKITLRGLRSHKEGAEIAYIL